MKILLISDLHGNYEALKEILERESFDEIFFMGDAVDYGPNPLEVIDFLNGNSKFNVMGNHDHAVAFDVDCQCAPAMHHLSEFSRDNITKKLLSKQDIDKIKKFREKIEVELEGQKFYLTHASPYNNLYGYLFSTEAEMVSRDEKLKEYSYIIVGHTHFPMMYKSRVINPGSAGQPRDGNWMPWYATLETESFNLQFKRFKYDRGKTIESLRNLIDSSLPEYSELVKFYS